MLDRINHDISQERCDEREENVKEHFDVRLRRAAVALVAMAALAVRTVDANPPNPGVVVPPADLAALARETGDATLIHEINDGITIFCIEQNQGARLAAFDVTDPLQIKGEGSICLGMSRLLDFVFPEDIRQSRSGFCKARKMKC